MHPIRADWRIDSGLHVSAIEVDLRSWREVIPLVDNAENIEKMRACVEDMVDVEAWVDFQCRRKYIVKEVTSLRNVLWQWQWTRWWESEVGVDVVGISAGVGKLLGSGHEARVQGKCVCPIVQIWHDRH